MNTTLDQLKQSLTEARAEVVNLLRIREEQTALVETVQDELAQLEVGRGDRVLDAIREGSEERVAWKESQEVLGKRTRLETAHDVLKALEPRIKAAKDHVVRCKAVCLRAEADVLDAQATERQGKTDKLLAELKKWENTDYVPYPNPARSITYELRRKAGYYKDCAERILKGQGYYYDPLRGDGSPVYPIPEYLGSARECQD